MPALASGARRDVITMKQVNFLLNVEFGVGLE